MVWKQKKQSDCDMSKCLYYYLYVYCCLLLLGYNVSNFVLADTLTNNKMLYINNSGKLATSSIQEEEFVNRINKVDTIESEVADMKNILTNIQQNLESKQSIVTAGTGVTITNNSIAVDLTALKTQLLDMIYPIGSVYITIGNSKPALGGTWERV